MYIVEDIIYHSETCEKMVAYRALYGDNKLWCRPYDMFLDEINKNGQKYRFELQDIKNEFVNGNKKAILITGITWGISIFLNLRAYQFGNVSIVAPLCALTVMLNVIVGYLFLKERDNLLRKIISAILIIISIILIRI